MKTITEAAKECEFHSIGNQHHFTPEQIAKDNLRTETLNNVGIRVLRFTNDEVINNVEKVKLKIYKVVNRRWKNKSENARYRINNVVQSITHYVPAGDGLRV
jgi:hypothetical protein